MSTLGQELISGDGTAVDDVMSRRGSPRVYLVVGAVAGVLFWLCRAYPSRLPVWAPWDFSWTEFLAAALGLVWFFRGAAALPLEARPPVWRRVSFTLGVGSIYVVLQTRVDYFALHMFFLNRIQHLVMHHLGPFLIALGCGGSAVKAGMPAPLAQWIEGRWLRRGLAIVQQPIVAAVLFVGLIYLWLIPAVHFRAMIDPGLYKVMNWSMVGDGLLFWSLVLDPRPHPPARLSFPVRAALGLLVMFPQIALGALLSFSSEDIYPYYASCGRLFPSISAVTDQSIGGIVIWLPASMMSVIALLLVFNFMRLEEDRSVPTPEEEAMAAAARRWTGR